MQNLFMGKQDKLHITEIWTAWIISADQTTAEKK